MFNLLPASGASYTPQDEIIVDLFAGGGGASAGIEMALHRSPDAAVNHNPKAVAMHIANHPDTVHYTEDVWNISPTWVTKGRPVGLIWASPDCTHFSKAKGGKPNRDDRIRSLALVIVDKWIPETHPRVIIMENVEEMQTWGPLDSSGVPIPEHAGDTWRYFLRRLRRAGYKVAWREMRACDYGAPTIRKRLFLVARCDGKSIVWPKPTHGDPECVEVKAGKLLPWRTAAECIDFSQPCPSIFESSKEIFEKHGIRAKRPLAENTLRRIAKGIGKYVLDCADPFIVKSNHTACYYNCFRGQGSDEPLQTITKTPGFSVVSPSIMKMRTGAVGSSLNEPMHTVTAGGKAKRLSTGNTMALVHPYLTTYYGPKGKNDFRGQNIFAPLATQTTENRHAIIAPYLTECANASNPRVFEAHAPLRTQCAQVKGGHFALCTAHIERSFSQSKGNSVLAPLGTTTADGGGKSALVTGFLAKHFTGVTGVPFAAPVPTVTTRDHNSVVTSSMLKMRGQNTGSETGSPLHTVSAGGNHHGEVRAFLCKYYGQGDAASLKEPAHTVTSKDRFGLVTIHGEQYVIADIGMRMLNPRELFLAQGFSADYIIELDYKGKPLSKADQVHMVGNSVCPPMAAALVTANCADMAVTAELEAV